MAYTPPLPQHIWYEFLTEYETPYGCNLQFALTEPIPEYLYTPRGCANIWFSLDGLYEIPYGCGIVFRVGESPDVDTFGFMPHNVEFFIDSGKLSTFSGEMIVPRTVNIIINADVEKVDPVWPISIKNATIGLSISEAVVEILPDMQIKNVVINSAIDKVLMRGTEDFHLPSGNSSDLKNFLWGNGVKAEKAYEVIWDTPTDTISKNSIRVVKHDTKDAAVVSPWEEMVKSDIRVVSSASEYENYDVSYLSSYKTLTSYDINNTKSWNKGKDVYLHKGIHYFHPDPKDMHKAITWDTPISNDELLLMSWKAPKPKDHHKSTPWGPFSYFTLCNENYRAPQGCRVEFEFPNKYELMPNICSGITFHVNNYMTANPRCQYIHNHSGIRDPYIWVDPENKNLIYPMDLGVYHMLNTVLVEEVITGTPIEVLHVDAKIDIGSWIWSFSVTVASKCFLDIIKPQGGILGNIKINMNGWIFFCTVEGWSENRAFGSQAWTITGRSPSLLFGAPISEPKSNIIDIGKQGAAIFEDYMIGRTYAPGWPFTTWEADFSSYSAIVENPVPTATGFQPSSDWYLPANTISYSDKTDIEILKELADSIGAYIQTSPTTSDGLKTGTSKLIVKPRYAHQPWNWKTDNADIKWKTINESQCVEIARSNEVRTEYQAVNVMGESVKSNEFDSGSDNESIYVNVVRDGWDSGGNEGSFGKYAPMVTSKYITGSKSGLENGRMIIGYSGEWIKHSLRIGILCENNGLYSVGDMVSVLERGIPWQGQVIGVNIAAVSAGVGFAIEQTIEVEEYRGE